jgi:uncharacterized protein
VVSVVDQSPPQLKPRSDSVSWLSASNGQVIATGGEGYSSKAAAQNGIQSVKRAAADASVEEV